MAEKVTAGQDALGDFAPTFAALNDDVLFGQVWSREEQLSPRIRSIVTVTALMSSGVLDGSLQHHIERAKGNVDGEVRRGARTGLALLLAAEQ